METSSCFSNNGVNVGIAVRGNADDNPLVLILMKDPVVRNSVYGRAKGAITSRKYTRFIHFKLMTHCLVHVDIM